MNDFLYLNAAFGTLLIAPSKPIATRRTRSPKTKPMMIRMDQKMATDIQILASANDLTISDIVRLAVREQMPAIRSGKTKLQPS